MASRASQRVRRGTRAEVDDSSEDSTYEGSESGDEEVVAGGASAQKWVQCDKCGQWRRLSGITDLKSLPQRWFCKLNPDLRYNDCKIPVIFLLDNRQYSINCSTSSIILGIFC